MCTFGKAKQPFPLQIHVCKQDNKLRTLHVGKMLINSYLRGQIPSFCFTIIATVGTSMTEVIKLLRTALMITAVMMVTAYKQVG